MFRSKYIQNGFLGVMAVASFESSITKFVKIWLYFIYLSCLVTLYPTVNIILLPSVMYMPTWIWYLFIIYISHFIVMTISQTEKLIRRMIPLYIFLNI